MVEKKYLYTVTEATTIERVIADENVNINHMVLPKNERLPQHNSNANVYMIVISGTVTLALDEQDEMSYGKGSILNIPNNTNMGVFNKNDEILELFVVKAPAPV